MGNGGEDWGPADIEVLEKNWGWSGWNPPDAGNAIQEFQSTPFGKFDGLRTLGGAKPNNDGRYVIGSNSSDSGQTAGVGGESVVEFLKNRPPKLGKPFCLFISCLFISCLFISCLFISLSTRTTSASIRAPG